MPDKISFATTNWKNKPQKPTEFTQGEWDAYNSSSFNGFPFPLLEKNQANSPFQWWDGVTKFQSKPSGSNTRLISVTGPHYSLKFTYDQLFSFFWRMKGRSLTLENVYTDQTIDKTSSNNRVQNYTLDFEDFENFTLVLDSESEPKNQESKLISEPATNKWIVQINGCKIEINFNEPVLKLGEDDYRVYVDCGCCGDSDCCMYGTSPFVDYDVLDLPDQVVAGGVVLNKREDAVGENDIFYADAEDDNQIQFVGNLWLLRGSLTISPGDNTERTFESGCLTGRYAYDRLTEDEADPPLPDILVEDQFANTYKVSSRFFSSWISHVTVTRKSLCEWSGEAEGQFDSSYDDWLAGMLEMDPNFVPPTNKIQAGITMNGTVWTVWMQSDCVFTSVTNSTVQGEPNFKHSDTPVGNYNNGGDSNAISVAQ